MLEDVFFQFVSGGIALVAGIFRESQEIVIGGFVGSRTDALELIHRL